MKTVMKVGMVAVTAYYGWQAWQARKAANAIGSPAAQNEAAAKQIIELMKKREEYDAKHMISESLETQVQIDELRMKYPQAPLYKYL